MKGNYTMDSIKLSTKVSSDERILSTKDSIKNISFALEKLCVYLASIHQLYDYDAMSFNDKIEAIAYVEKYGYERLVTIRKLKNWQSGCFPNL